MTAPGPCPNPECDCDQTIIDLVGEWRGDDRNGAILTCVKCAAQSGWCASPEAAVESWNRMGEWRKHQPPKEESMSEEKVLRREASTFRIVTIWDGEALFAAGDIESGSASERRVSGIAEAGLAPPHNRPASVR